jgi:hypothetical protein
MKRTLIIATVLILVVGAGVTSARFYKPQLQVTPHTIVYRIKFLDPAGKVESSSIVFRQVSADGTWKNVQVKDEDGKVSTSSGKLTTLMHKRTADAKVGEYLNVSYFEDKTKDTESWISADLQDYLKLTTFHENGAKVTMEALNVSIN